MLSSGEVMFCVQVLAARVKSKTRDIKRGSCRKTSRASCSTASKSHADCSDGSDDRIQVRA